MRKLEASGWRLDRQRGSHAQCVHADRPGILITVPMHTGDVNRHLLTRILKLADLD
ncbi:MAG: type II toxin-antitoxin system HicA family toxin [Fimbriimonadaceae bacterium]|nr:type II toxin-antitoxin system HicA family toxin [Fimbriimonadaceae bacterium]